MNALTKAIPAAILLLFSMAHTAWAGPPFQTDDPEPIDFKNYEFYTFATADGTAVEMDTAGPAVEFNWGALPNVHLHIIVPLAGIFPSNNPAYAPSGTGPNIYGLGDIETGVKLRFIQETKHRPMVGTFTMIEVPSGSAERGLGVGKTWYKVPIWLQKSFGPWTTYGGAGATLFNHSPGYRDFPYAGWLLQRKIGEKWTLAAKPSSMAAKVSRPRKREAPCFSTSGATTTPAIPAFNCSSATAIPLLGSPRITRIWGCTGPGARKKKTATVKTRRPA